MQIGQLDGHVNTLTSVTVIRGTPVCVSADDKGTVKTWDLRSR